MYNSGFRIAPFDYWRVNSYENRLMAMPFLYPLLGDLIHSVTWLYSHMVGCVSNHVPLVCYMPLIMRIPTNGIY